MKRMFAREFVVYSLQGKVVIFNYPTQKGRKNRGVETMYIKRIFPTPSSWKRIEYILWGGKFPCEMATDEKTGERSFVFIGGASLS